MGGWGISRLIFLKSAIYFVGFVLLKSRGLTLLADPLLYTCLVFLLVSIASNPKINLPMLLGKSTDGSFPIWSILIFGPYLYFVRLFWRLRRLLLLSREEPYHGICEGVFVGGWPCSPDKFPPNRNRNTPAAIIDCTCEFPRSCHLSKNPYLCVPTCDTRSPHPAQIESAVKWACRKRALGVPVFIHCAYGHGRSVAVMCALLVALGVVDNWKDAEKLIQKKRPYIRMNSLHRKALEEWAKHRLSPARKVGTDVSSVMSNSLPS